MKSIIITGIVCATIGLWVGTQIGSPDQDESQAQDENANTLNRHSNRLSHPRSASTSTRTPQEDSNGKVTTGKNQELLEAVESGEPESLIRVIRGLIESESHFGTRIPSVCEVLSLMNEENAQTMKAAFDQSWAAGYDYYWERELFIDRYSEIVGFQAIKEYPYGKPRHRAIGGWARANPDDAISWVNELEDGPEKNHSINAVMWNVTKDNPDYGLQVFRSLPQEEQVNRIGSLMQLTRRQGGAPACANLAEKLRTSESAEDRILAAGAYQKTLLTYQEGPAEKMDAWLNQLPEEALSLLEPHLLPKKHPE